MATPIEQRVLPRITELADLYGTPITFTLYPNAVPDSDNSVVALGTPETHVVQCFPPQEVIVEYEEDGNAVERRGLKVTVPSGAETSSPLAFIPAQGQRFDIGDGRTYRVVKVQDKHSGEEIAVYIVYGVE